MALTRAVCNISRIGLPSLTSSHVCIQSQQMSTGELGSGAGKGGGSGGSVRDAGGAFGKLEAAREGEYFYKLQKLQLKNISKQLHDEVDYHEKQLKHHQAAIDRHKKRMAELSSEEKALDKH